MKALADSLLRCEAEWAPRVMPLSVGVISRRIVDDVTLDKRMSQTFRHYNAVFLFEKIKINKCSPMLNGIVERKNFNNVWG